MTSLLLHPETLPLRDAETVGDLGRTLVVAPHPDDESLGCGGLLALLAASEQGARVVFVTDGTRSHPNSPSYPPEWLRALREAEAEAALAALGLAPEAALFLRYPDCGLPQRGTGSFETALDRVTEIVRDWAPETVLLPWRRDPHCDHVDAWALFRAALHRFDTPLRVLEYPVWAWPHADGPEAPRADEANAWRVDIRSVLDRKRAAIAAHRSQTTWLIADDPDAFILRPHMLRHFERPWELFLEVHDA